MKQLMVTYEAVNGDAHVTPYRMYRNIATVAAPLRGVSVASEVIKPAARRPF
jgi:hypothetical protein